ncbi:MAG: 2-hydroxychromene-2-carboxylate isomerase [Pseudomonadota bacterium]
MPGVVEYWFAPISGYAYLGHKPLMRLSAKTGATVHFRPVEIARLFAASETTPPFAQSPARQAYRVADQARWAVREGLAMASKPKHWPTAPGLACRVILAAGALGLDQGEVSFACLKGVWADEIDIADPQQLSDALDQAGFPGHQILARADVPDMADESELITKEGIDRGIFGSPTFMVDGQMFWGQDRLDFVRAALLQEAA